MKRKLLLALIALTCALCLVFSLAGCNPAENQSGAQQETPGGQGSGSSDSEDNSEGQGSGQQGGNSDEHVHNYGELIPEQPATCKKEGLQAHYYCEGCEKYFDSEKHETTLEKLKIDIDLNAHSYGELIPEQPATCTAEGMQAHYYCEVCKKYFDSEKHETTLEQLKISANTHNYIYKCGQTEHWQVCADCGEETAHTPHSVSDGVCPACGYVEKCTEGLKFTEIKENDEIIGYGVTKGTATDSHIFIPSFYNNLPVLSIGQQAFRECTNLEKITIGNSVTSIGEYAFRYCTSLAKITIPDSVTSIGAWAFADCKSLKEITIGNGVTSIGEQAFRYCTSITEITIPNSVTSIGSGAFAGCTSLTEITIPDSVTSIGNRAFEGCTNIKTATMPTLAIIYIPKNNLQTVILTSGDSIGIEAFFGYRSLKEISIPDSVTSIGEYAFQYCESLTEITIPNSVTSIGEYAFLYCTSLKNITIPDSVTSIGKDAFSGCTSLEGVYINNISAWCNIDFGTADANPLDYAHILYLKGQLVTNLEIPNGVTAIENFAFAGCTSFTEITIPDSVTFIYGGAFSGCTSLTDITIPDSVTSIDKDAFSNTAYYNDADKWKNNVLYIGNYLIEAKETLSGSYQIPSGTKLIADFAFEDCKSLKEITIPDSVTSIGANAFNGCTSLTEITIGNGVTSIGYGAFDRCINLERVNFSNNSNLTSIDGNAFYGCTSLTKITIPASVTYIGWFAFCGCSSLTEITIPDSVNSIEERAFVGCKSLERVIFENTEGWKVFYILNYEEINVEDPEQNAENLKDKYSKYYWKRGE